MTFKYKNTAHKISKGLKYTIFATNVVAILLLLLSVQSPSVSPSQFIFIAYLGMGFPILFVINLLYLLLWIVTFRWKYALIQLLVFIICIDPITTYFPINSPVKEIPQSTIKLMTYNVRGFNWLHGEEARTNPIFDYLTESGADVICMQEFSVEKWQNRKKIISLAEFDNIMQDYPYRSIIRLGDTIGSTIYGLACYSKYPIRKVARIPVESEFNGSGMYQLRIGDQDLVIVNNHLESNRITAEDKELFKELVEKKDRSKINKVVESVFKRLDPAFKERGVQADIISAYVALQRKKTPKMIILGDFNDTPMSYAYGKMRGDFIDSFKATGRGLGITYHEDGFLFRIDFIMYTPDLKSYNCRVGKIKYSDHYPLISHIQL